MYKEKAETTSPCPDCNGTGIGNYKAIMNNSEGGH